MTRSKDTAGFSTPVGVALTLFAVIAGGWLVYRYGPKPSSHAPSLSATASAAPSPSGTAAAGRPAEPARAADEQPGPAGGTGGEGNAINPFMPSGTSGQVAKAPGEYLKEMQEVYRRRGYQSLGSIVGGRQRPRTGRAGSKKESPELKNYYWTFEPEGGKVAYIGAVGHDSDPRRDERSAQPRVCTTTIFPDGGSGSQWSTHCLDMIDRKAVADFKHSTADLEGSDPPGVPRPPGLRRLFTFRNSDGLGQGASTLYTSDEPGNSLMRWYLTHMVPNWEHTPIASAETRGLAGGAMCFTQGHRFCLIWVSPGDNGNPTTVIVSWRQ
jgi:hypothetical protein